MLKQIRSRRYADTETQGGLDDVQNRWSDALALGVFHNGTLFESQPVAAATTLRIFHNLGRVPKFAICVLASADVRIWVKSDVDPLRYVSIAASGSATVNILVV